MVNKYKSLKPNSKCLWCLGCSLLNSPAFKGRQGCGQFRQDGKQVWCANETVEHFLRTGKVKGG